MELSMIRFKQVINIKEINIVAVILLCGLVSCRDAPKENKGYNWKIWRIERFHNYLFQIPGDAKLYVHTKDTNSGILSNGKVIGGFVSGGNINIDVFEGYGLPTLYDSGTASMKIKSIGEYKEKMLKYTGSLNKGLLLICVWDTVKIKDILDSRRSYKEFVLSQKKADSTQRELFIKIFDSIKIKRPTRPRHSSSTA